MAEVKLAYVAHPFGGVSENLDRAERWAAVLNALYEGLLFWAPWIPLCRHWTSSWAGFRSPEEALERGMALDLSAVRMSRALIAVNVGSSTGAKLEVEEATRSGIVLVHINCPSAYHFSLDLPEQQRVRELLRAA